MDFAPPADDDCSDSVHQDNAQTILYNENQ